MKVNTIEIVSSPRELETKKRVGDVVADYSLLETETIFKVISEKRTIEFTNQDYNNDNCDMTIRENNAIIKELLIKKFKLNTGEKETFDNPIYDKNDKKKEKVLGYETKERVKILNTKTLIEIII